MLDSLFFVRCALEMKLLALKPPLCSMDTAKPHHAPAPESSLRRGRTAAPRRQEDTLSSRFFPPPYLSVPQGHFLYILPRKLWNIDENQEMGSSALFKPQFSSYNIS